jgi:hypothetical protein
MNRFMARGTVLTGTHPLAAAATAFVFGLLAPGCGTSHRPADDVDTGPPTPQVMAATPFITPGVKQPPTVPAADASLNDGEEVIGVRVNDHYRAYRVRALKTFPQHVVDDVIDGRPVSVTHCDRTGCTKVFTSDQGEGPLNLDLGGWAGDQMLLRTAGQFYLQDTLQTLSRSPSAGSFPFREYEFQRTTWKAWKEAHPETDVYVGADRHPAGGK